MKLFTKLKEIIEKVKTDVEEITDLTSEDRKKLVKALIFEAAMAYGRAKIQEEMNGKV